MLLVHRWTVGFLSKNIIYSRVFCRSISHSRVTILERIVPYTKLARLDRPIGIALLYWPCAWSIQMGSFASVSAIPCDPFMLSLFLVGATVMRGAGCTINDLWDRNIDSKVERTKNRPLASGKLVPRQAITFLALQLSLGLAILLQLNTYCIAIGTLSLIPVAVYPLMKRITYWPQIMLGIAFNWGALIGMPAALNLSFNDIFSSLQHWKVTLPLYLGGICWTLVYDTIYAHQDKVDDLIVGVKSTALRFGNKTPLILSAFSVSSIILWNIAAFNNHHSWILFSLMNPFLIYHFYYQIWNTNYDSPSDCLKKFKSNHYLGFGLFILFFIDTLYKKYLDQ